MQSFQFTKYTNIVKYTAQHKLLINTILSTLSMCQML